MIALLNRSSFNSRESLEVLRQNIQTAETLFSLKSPLTIADKKRPFGMCMMKLQIGQWVDVKDTIDQWLEAQVTRLSGNRVFVHYNGWGSRWDEWIDAISPRIALFRTHTIQMSTSKYISPSPNILPDADNHEIPAFAPTLKGSLEKTSTVMEQLRNMMELFINISGQDERNAEFAHGEEQKIDYLLHNRKLQLAAQLAPLMDRVGRVLGDLSPHLADMASVPGSSNQEIDPNPHVRDPRIPLIANAGDVSTITNIMDRFLFGETPSIELHIHAFLTPAQQNWPPRPYVSQPPPAPVAAETSEFSTQTEHRETSEAAMQAGTAPESRETAMQTVTIVVTPVRPAFPQPKQEPETKPRASGISVAATAAMSRTNGEYYRPAKKAGPMRALAVTPAQNKGAKLHHARRTIIRGTTQGSSPGEKVRAVLNLGVHKVAGKAPHKS